jgi:hypothetical protein
MSFIVVTRLFLHAIVKIGSFMLFEQTLFLLPSQKFRCACHFHQVFHPNDFDGGTEEAK